MSSSPDRAIGQGGGRLGRYQIVRRLAVGGMGEVFLAREQGVAAMGRLVVVKQLLPELAEDPEAVARFVDEARVAAQLVHPGIVQVYELGNQDGHYFLAMEYVPGPSLARLAARAGQVGRPLERRLAVHIVAELARALDFSHRATDPRGKPLELVHRDVSPPNLLVSRHGDVKLMDFGIARASIRRQRTDAGTLKGKLAYMSPEQASGAEIDQRSDLFSAGIILWELTCGRRLFHHEDELETLRRVAACQVPAPRSIDPDYPPALEAAVMTALAPRPAERFPSAAALTAALQTVLAGATVTPAELGRRVDELFPDYARPEPEPVRVTMPPVLAAAPPTKTSASPVSPAPRRRRWPLALAIAALLAGATVVLIVLLGRSDGTADQAAIVVDAATLPPEGGAQGGGGDASPVDAAPPAPLASPPIDAGSRRSDRRKPDARRGPDPPVDPPIDQPAEPPPPPPPPPGELVVAADPDGRVKVDGVDLGYTDLQRKMPAGTVRVEVTMFDGSGTFRASARIESARKTKCQLTSGRLSCAAPR